jgi:hypothetical protein
VTDGRTILSVERLLSEGAVFTSELDEGKFVIAITMPDGLAVTGYGDTFPAAFRQALAFLGESL